MEDRAQRETVAVLSASKGRGLLGPMVLFLALIASLVSGQEGTASSASAEANTAAQMAADQKADAMEADEKTVGETDVAGDDGPEVDWLTDDFGRYQVLQVPKGTEGRHYVWIGEDRVQLHHGLRYQVAKHDATHFWIKVYEPSHKLEVPKVVVETEADRAAKLAVETAYTTDAGEVDRLSFVAFDAGLPRTGQWRNGFDVADMNADGHLDIVFGPARKSTPRPNIFLGNGEGRWATWRVRYPNFPYDYGAATVADFNNDGHLDIAYGMHLRGLLVLVGNSAGKFEPWSDGIGLEVPGQGGGGTTFSSTALAPVDWDSDGDMDLLALGEGPKGVRVIMEEGGSLQVANGPIIFVNHGDGTWNPHGKASRVFGSSVAVGDFNGDGRVDFATSNNSHNHNLLNLGGEGLDWQTERLTILRPDTFAYSVASSDLNGDQQDDLAVGYLSNEGDVWRSGVDILFSGENGNWGRKALYAVEGRFGVFAVDTGDLDGDGKTDVGVVNGRGEVKLFLGNGDGSFDEEKGPRREFTAPIEGCKGYGLRLVDLNKDGLDEVIVALSGEGTGLPGILDKPGCPGGGSIRAWSPRLTTAGDDTEMTEGRASR